MSEYTIVTDNVQKLAESVERMLSKGWEPVGGPFSVGPGAVEPTGSL